MELTDMDIFRSILADARASGLDIDDLIEAAKHADCIMCFDDAVGMLGIGAIDPAEFRFEFTLR